MAKKQIIPRLKVWLLLGNSISQAEAIEKWDAYRLSHSIFILRTKYGMNIKTEMCTSKNSVFAKYSLETVKPKIPCYTRPTNTTKSDHTAKAGL